MIEIVFFVLGVVGVSLFAWGFSYYTGMTYDGYPANPFKWAQESRRRDRIARRLHISRLEHELGYRPCSDETCLSPKCIVAGTRNGGHPIWDDPSLPAPPPMDTTVMVKTAYDKALDMDIDMYYDYGKRSYVINTKRDGMAMSNVIPEEALRDFEFENYALLQNLTRPAPPPPTAEPGRIRK